MIFRAGELHNKKTQCLDVRNVMALPPGPVEKVVEEDVDLAAHPMRLLRHSSAVGGHIPRNEKRNAKRGSHCERSEAISAQREALTSKCAFSTGPPVRACITHGHPVH
jgi:hypothetical protein